MRPERLHVRDANLVNQRAVPNTDSSGTHIGNLGQAYFVAPGKWIRFRTPAGSDPEVWVSDDNGATWRHRATISLQLTGGVAVSEATVAPVVYTSVAGQQRGPDGDSRIGLIKLADVFGAGITTFGEPNVIYLPSGGSLPIRATMFDWHAIFGVNPADADHIVAPDKNNDSIWVSHTGGSTWAPDPDLTNRITNSGEFLLFDADPYRTQVTEIAFDPYSERIVIGTRDAGVVYRDAYRSWTRIDWSERMNYTTGFFFKRDQTAVASTYGRGLWTVDFAIHYRTFPHRRFCRAPCRLRFPHDPRRIVDPPDWKSLDVTVFLNGRMNGLVLKGDRVATVTVTPATTYERFLGRTPSATFAPLPIIQSKRGRGFGKLEGPKAALAAGEVIKGIILEKGKIWGILSGEAEFESVKRRTMSHDNHLEGEQAADKPKHRQNQPRLTLSTNLATPGIPVVGADGMLHVFAADLSPDPQAKRELLIDGEPVPKTQLRVRKDGTLATIITVPIDLPVGGHRLELRESVKHKKRVAQARFVTAWHDEADEDEQ